MAIKKKSSRRGKIKVDLTGPKGNCFYLLGLAQQLTKQLNLDYDADAITEEMTLGDYEHLIHVFDKYFGNWVDLYR